MIFNMPFFIILSSNKYQGFVELCQDREVGKYCWKKISYK